MKPTRPDRMIEVLTAQRDAMVATYLRQVQAAVPQYAALPAAQLIPSFEILVDTVIITLREHDVSILARMLEQPTAARLAQGFSAESQITATRLIESIARDTLKKGLADDPTALADAMRRIDRLAATSRSIIGRILLAQMTDPSSE